MRERVGECDVFIEDGEVLIVFRSDGKKWEFILPSERAKRLAYWIEDTVSLIRKD